MNIIDRQSARLARLVDDLLFVSRIEAGRIRLQMEKVDLGELLREGVEALGSEGRGRVRLSVEPPHSEVVVDPQRLDQIVRNLVENALKFSDASDQVDVEGCVGDEQVEIAVTDHGIGIAGEEVPQIFDRFHQVGQVLTRETEGAGLGLYITKRLVEAMGGKISVTSEPGQGSTFRVTLPNRPASEVGTRATRGSAGTWIPDPPKTPPVGSTLVEGSA